MSAKASVKVHVLFEVEVDAGWGAACTIGQAQEQGAEAAEQTVRRALEGDQGARKRLGLPRITCTEVLIRSES